MNIKIIQIYGWPCSVIKVSLMWGLYKMNWWAAYLRHLM